MTPVAPAGLQLYLVRHAVAAERGPDYTDDTRRPLTDEGRRRFAAAVSGLRAAGVTLDVILTSPLTRARETADVLRAGLKVAPRLVVTDALAPGGRFPQLMSAITTAAAGRDVQRVALVGHEPDLGETARRLLGARGDVQFKKGAVCRIDVDRALPEGAGTLRWFLPPRVLRGLAP